MTKVKICCMNVSSKFLQDFRSYEKTTEIKLNLNEFVELKPILRSICNFDIL